jgi:hypothetical protein
LVIDALPSQDLRSSTRVSTLSKTSSIDNQIGHDHQLIDQTSKNVLGAVSESGIDTDSSSFDKNNQVYRGRKFISILSKKTAVSMLARNEKMGVDLLDKTISTQEILAAQQHLMTNVMRYHGAQLQRIFSAIHRLETILSERGTKSLSYQMSSQSMSHFNIL